MNAPGDFSVDGLDGRVDYVVSPAQKVFGRLTWKNVDDVSPSGGDWNTTQGDHFRRTEVRQIAAAHNWVRGSFVNEFRGGWSNTVEKDTYTNALAGPGLVSATGLVGLPGPPGTGGFPHFEFADGSFISTGGVKPFDILSRVVQGGNTTTWTAGRHTMKAGIDLQYVEYRDQISFFDGEELGRYVFDGTFTGQAFADFLSGLPHFTGYILPAPDVNPFSTYYAGFVQDTWRPLNSVTVDAGLRYDLRPPMFDRSNQLGNFDTGVPGGRVIVSDEAGLALVPSLVRQSVPNTPFLRPTKSGCRRRCAAPTEQLESAHRNRVAAGRVGAHGGSRRIRPLHRAAAGIGELLDGRNRHRGGRGFCQQPGEPVRLSQHVVGRIGRGRAAAGDAGLPPRQPDRHARSSLAAVEPEPGARPGMEDRRRVSYVGSTTEDLIWSPDLNQVPANTLGYDAVKNTRPFTDWNVVTTRASDPRSRYDALGLELNKRFSAGLALNASVHPGSAPLGRRRHGAERIRRRERGDDR